MKFRFKKKWGQHFLKNEMIVNEIINIEKLSEKNIIEIGPGNGVLTRAILKQKPKFLTSIEKDESLRSELKQFEKKNNDNFKLIFDDIFNFNIEELYKKGKITIIANLPYNIATKLIIDWMKNIEIFNIIVVMVQREVADRLTAKFSSSSYGRTSIIAQLHSIIEKKIDVPPDNFFPKPKVHSTVLKITPKKKKVFNFEKLDFLLKESFKYRRKKLISNLSRNFEESEKMFAEKGLNTNIRAQDISPEKFLEILKYLN